MGLESVDYAALQAATPASRVQPLRSGGNPFADLLAGLEPASALDGDSSIVSLTANPAASGSPVAERLSPALSLQLALAEASKAPVEPVLPLPDTPQAPDAPEPASVSAETHPPVAGAQTAPAPLLPQVEAAKPVIRTAAAADAPQDPASPSPMPDRGAFNSRIALTLQGAEPARAVDSVVHTSIDKSQRPALKDEADQVDDEGDTLSVASLLVATLPPVPPAAAKQPDAQSECAAPAAATSTTGNGAASLIAAAQSAQSVQTAQAEQPARPSAPGTAASTSPTSERSHSADHPDAAKKQPQADQRPSLFERLGDSLAMQQPETKQTGQTVAAHPQQPQVPATAVQIQPPVQQSSAKENERPQVTLHVQHHQDVAERVGMMVTRAANENMREFTIRLDPPELGRIDIKLNVDSDGKVQAVIASDNANTHDLLRREASSLERSLTDNGLKTDSGSLSFNLRDGQTQQQRDAQHQSQPLRLFGDAGDSGNESVPQAILLPLRERFGTARVNITA